MINTFFGLKKNPKSNLNGKYYFTILFSKKSLLDIQRKNRLSYYFIQDISDIKELHDSLIIKNLMCKNKINKVIDVFQNKNEPNELFYVYQHIKHIKENLFQLSKLDELIKECNSTNMKEYCIFRSVNETPILIQCTPDYPGFLSVKKVQGITILKDFGLVPWSEFFDLLDIETKNHHKNQSI